MGDKTFTFDNWKKSNRLKKHAKSVVHKDARTKWIGSKINAKYKTSVLKQLTESHQQDVLRNREYLRIIITVYSITHNKTLLLEDMTRTEIILVKGPTKTEEICWNY